MAILTTPASISRLIKGSFRKELLVLLISVLGTSAAWTSGTGGLGAVSSESRLCSEIGTELLERGVSDVELRSPTGRLTT